MKIVALSMVGNEADVVECFVRHTLSHVDHMFLILHRSVDGTAEIVRALEAEGLPVTIKEPRFAGFSQGAELTHLAKSLFAHPDPAFRADFVVPLDADEFLKLPSRDYLYRALPAVPGEFYPAVRWENYFPMHPGDLLNMHTLRALTYRRQDDSAPTIYKVMLNQRFLDSRACVFEGTHCVILETKDAHVPAQMIELKAIRLAHFPVRSSFQMARKAHIGVLAKGLKSEGQASGLGTHWQGLREQLGKNRDNEVEFARLRAIAFHYPQTFHAETTIDDRLISCSPIDCDFDLRYTHLMRTNLAAILDDWVRA